MRYPFVWRALAEARARTGRRLFLRDEPGGWYLFDGAHLLGRFGHPEQVEARLAILVSARSTHR